MGADTDRFSLAEAADYYGVPHWGAPYFRLDRTGQLIVSPEGRPDRSAPLVAMIRDAREREGLQAPFLLRFPQILAHRLHGLAKSFERSVEDFEYRGRVQGVFPIKVNQRRWVLESLMEAGAPLKYGLEVGSKAELALALSLPIPEDAWLICNGYKDDDYVALALAGRRMGLRVAVILEKPGELDLVLRHTEQQAQEMTLGIRLRLSTRGTGHWEGSGGEWAKFGLSTGELLTTVGRLRAAGKLDWLHLLHFHIGSQITNVRRVKDAVREAARIYAKLHETCPALAALDVGGGQGVDYIGNRSEDESSVNYTLQEYTNTIVYGIADVCEEEEIPTPDIVFESGRAVAAHHALLVVQALTEHVPGVGPSVGPLFAPSANGETAPAPGGAAADVGTGTRGRESVPGAGAGAGAGPGARSARVRREDWEFVPRPGAPLRRPPDGDHKILHDLFETYEGLNADNFLEFYHDALEYRELLSHAWGFGDLSLEEKARGEHLFREICRKALAFGKGRTPNEEQFQQLERNLAEKYLLNFSLFQSLPDTWAFDQMFPVVPLDRLAERPTVPATLCDVTCDSDGIIEQFVGEAGQRDSLFLHRVEPREQYYLGIFLVGAYQDVLGDYHNLFGQVGEVEARVGAAGQFELRRLHAGDDIAHVLQHFASPEVRVDQAFDTQLARRAERAGLADADRETLRAAFHRALNSYTYLIP